MFEPFILPSQVTQMFFSDDMKRPCWKVVLRKEVHSRREMFGIKDVFIMTTLETNGLSVPIIVFPPPNNVSLIGAIELSDQDHFLACAKFWDDNV